VTGNLSNSRTCLADAIEDMVAVPHRHRLGV
jgi:hypothetical protein